jgi:hypothetical protein
MKLSKIVSILVMLGTASELAGCATHSANLKPPPNSNTHIRLQVPFIYETAGGGVFGGGTVVEVKLAAGDYRPIGQDLAGVYYKGPAYCYREEVTKIGGLTQDSLLHKGRFADCGILLPTDPSAAPKMFINFRTLTAFPGYLTSAQMSAEDANLALKRQAAMKPADTAAATQATLNTLVVQSALNPPAGASAMQGALGGAIGAGLISAIIAADDGDISVWGAQPDAAKLRAAIEMVDVSLPQATRVEETDTAAPAVR